MDLRFEQFPALSAIKICRHFFAQRIPGVDVSDDKAEVLERLDAAHRKIRNATGFSDWPLFTAEQVHGNNIAVLDEVGSAFRADTGGRGAASVPSREFPTCDGIITNLRSVLVGIYVADCCGVYIVDPTTPAIGLVHSGRKGTELGVVTNAIRQMIERFGSDPASMIVQLSPCIRPPHYGVDFAAEIIRQCRALDVQHIHDSGMCTACDLGRYYSYRAEKGKTGRMLAVLGMTQRRDPRLRSRGALSISASGAVAARFVTIHTGILPTLRDPAFDMPPDSNVCPSLENRAVPRGKCVSVEDGTYLV